MTSPQRLRTIVAAFLALAMVVTACSGDAGPAADPAPAPDTTEPTAEAAEADPTATPEQAVPDPTPVSDTDDGGDADQTNDDATTDSLVTSVLTSGPATHLGASWFSPPDPDAEELIWARWDDVNEASSIGRAMFDWIDVEPEQGVYRFDEVDEALAGLVDAGLQPMLSVVARDTSGTEWPEWLDGFDPAVAATAYLTMAEQLAPIMERHGVWMFAIANEPPLDDETELDRGDFATFVELVVSGMDDVTPGLPTTFTFAGGDPLIDDPDIDRMVAAVDVFSVNHYCLQPDLRVIDMADAIPNIDRLVARAGDLPVVFQEFGCPASEIMGSSDEYQLAWFEVAYEHIATVEQVRAAFVFEFLDWSQETFDANYGDVTDLLVDELGQDFTDRFTEWLLTSGLVRSDGSTRPAFDLFLETAPELASRS